MAACRTASGSESGPDDHGGLGLSFAIVVPRYSPLAMVVVAIGVRDMARRAKPVLAKTESGVCDSNQAEARK